MDGLVTLMQKSAKWFLFLLYDAHKHLAYKTKDCKLIISSILSTEYGHLLGMLAHSYLTIDPPRKVSPSSPSKSAFYKLHRSFMAADLPIQLRFLHRLQDFAKNRPGLKS
jgi:hypothetical protein